jgi:hydrogenase nickel incorporation protein HypA/HybF
MHELAIASRLLGRALSVADEYDADRIDGEVTHLAPDQLRFCLSAAADGTPAEGATVEIESVPPEGACDCGWRGTPERIDATVAAPRRRCPECGDAIDLVAGDDCDLAAVDLP